MKTIAVLTLTFLPGTAVAVSNSHHRYESDSITDSSQSFFSMTMFQWPYNGNKIASPYLWVYFAVTIPLTALVYVAWVWWFKFSQKQSKKKHDEGLDSFEKELKMRVRTATGTGTW